jgi:hypothetical protein
MSRLHPALSLLAVLIAIGLAVTAAAPVYADLGPKPTENFTFAFEVPAVSIESGVLLQCQDAQCADGKPLQEGGPQRFTCVADSCHALAYGFAPYQQLVIRFGDRERRSNVFTKSAFDAEFRVTVRENDLLVSEQWIPGGSDPTARLASFGGALVQTLILELVAGALYVWLRHRPWRLLLWIALGSLLSLPVVWYVFPALGWGMTPTLVAAEAFAWLFEAALLARAGRLPAVEALVLSLVLNGLSAGLGLLLMG